MQGKVIMINLKRGVIVVEIEYGDYSVVEILGDDPIGIGDTIKGNLQDHGHQTFNIVTQNNMKFSGYVQGYNCTLQNARNLIS